MILNKITRIAGRSLFIAVLAGLALPVMVWAQANTKDDLTEAQKVPDALAPRPVPRPLPGHPGNVFLEGQEVQVRVPAELPPGEYPWRMTNMEGETVRQGHFSRQPETPGTRLSLGSLPVGYYRVEFWDGNEQLLTWTSSAVLAPWTTTVPGHSPVAVDAAISWFAGKDAEAQRNMASLAALAGVSWVRDRLRWRDVQPEPDTWASPTHYDMAAEIQQKAGLKVLQVFHDTPPWAREGRSGGEFTHDLRILYRFCQGMARRFKGGVNAWEPWNEANVKNFGGHTVNEMCSWQKAAWLGFKAGDPEVLVGWNATAASPTDQHAEGVLANETWPYFDTYNIHTYDWAHAYLDLWGPALKAASGRPLWITESDRGLKHINNPPWYDLSPSDERLKAEYMAQSYAQSLYVGASRHFHFVLGHYHEANGVQFGLLRKDLAPRPAYVALAAIGRFLAGAQSLGRWRPGHDVQVYGFRARPDGVEKDVLVAWAEKEVDWPARGVTDAEWNPPETMRCEEVFDFLGRSMGATIPPRLQSAPIFLVLPQGAADKISWQKQPETEFRVGDVSPVVLQILMPSSRRIRVEDKEWSEGHAYRFEVGEEMEITMAAYNFGEQPVKGSVVLKDIPLGWRLSSDQWDLELKPMERDTVSLKFVVAAGEGDKVTEDGWIKIQGRFGLQNNPVVAFRMVRN